MFMKRKNFSGVYAAAITPFNKDESLDFGALREMIDIMVDAGLDGLLIAGNTGEFTLMSPEERKALVKASVEAAAGRIKIIASSCAHWTAGTMDFIKYHDSVGVDFHLINPPYDTPTSWECEKAYFEEICEAAEAGIVIHNNAAFPNACLTPEQLAELAEIDNLIGVKDVCPFSHYSRTLQLTRDNETFSVFSGYEDTILAGFAIGVDGTMGTASMVAPKLVKQLYDYVQDNDLNSAREIQKKINVIADAVLEMPFPSGLKIGCELVGIPAGIARKPLGPAPAGMKERIEAAFRSVGLL